MDYAGIFWTKPFIYHHVYSRLPKTIPLGTIQSVLSAAYQELQHDINTEFYNKTVLRDIAVLELLFATGVRVSELCSLTIDDVNLSEVYKNLWKRFKRADCTNWQ